MIDLSGVQKWYGEYHALRGIDLQIAAGEFFSLLGPSGCGKTTLLRTIAGFEGIDAGTLRIDGLDMRGVTPDRRPTNMVFQSYAIFPHLTVAQNVAYGLRRTADGREEKARRVGEALEMVGLGGYGGRRPHELSGGQRQRVALARALVLRPKVLLLDEPLSALDRKMRETMQSELRRLQRQVGITFILVTHDQEEALIMSDRVAVMFEGAIAQVASPQALYSRPADRRVADFLGAMNFLPAEVRDGRVEIAGLGACEVEPEQVIGAGGMAEAGMRPEAMTMLDVQPGEGLREAAGTIADRAYYGDMTYYMVELPGVPGHVTVSMKNRPGSAVLDVGAPARIGWDPRAVLLFPA
ncbi:ABC transporter ATP-binding protein [Hasllibacter halocynthiae]|uniref:ABC transporter ATP-binding protein n=1 Tax=Hasllibacter halocynthiae TaxID=595589 RepID=UPI000D04EBE6|nr:ABC transporter ATP-binding protein [Hasllibacter halocynthiae]